jgi:hypothetical protein
MGNKLKIGDRIVWIDRPIFPERDALPHLKGSVIEKGTSGMIILYENGRSIFYTNDKLELFCNSQLNPLGNITLDKEYYREEKINELIGL